MTKVSFNSAARGPDRIKERKKIPLQRFTKLHEGKNDTYELVASMCNQLDNALSDDLPEMHEVILL